MITYKAVDITKRYRGSRTNANDGISLSIHRGEVFGLLGPNGAGKTTMVRILSGLTKPTTGQVFLYDYDIVKSPYRVSEFVALQPQDAMSIWNLTVKEALYYAGHLRGQSHKSAQAQASEMIERLHLERVSSSLTKRLSGGQRRLVTIGATFMAARPIMMFDEPTNDLDPDMRTIVWNTITEHNRQGATVILVTHNLLEAQRVLHRVAFMYEGQVITIGNVNDLIKSVGPIWRLEVVSRSLGKSDIDLAVQHVRVESMTHNKLVCVGDIKDIADTMASVVQNLGLDQCEDIKIISPTLEDVYFSLGGRRDREMSS